jgi:hypothetical protein
LPGKTHQKIEAKGGNSENENQGRDAIVIRRRKQQRQDHDDYGERYQRKQPVVLQQAKSIGPGQHVYTRSTVVFPNNPCGMANSTARMTTKATASL